MNVWLVGTVVVDIVVAVLWRVCMCGCVRLDVVC
jgi:hypothetical protein